MDKEVVKELIQDELTVNNITLELKKILENPKKQEQLKKDYNRLKEILGKGGHASENAAKTIYVFLRNQLSNK